MIDFQLLIFLFHLLHENFDIEPYNFSV